MNEDNELTLRIEEIAMAKMIKAKALEMGSPVANYSLMEIVRAHRASLRVRGMVRKAEGAKP